MPAYDSVHFDPPAPMAYVTLRNPDIGAALPDIAMLLDTGSDITLVPRSVIQPLGASLVHDTLYELSGFDGSKSLAPVVRLELLFLRRTFRGQFLVIDQEVGILGRNVLNRVALLLDGPGLQWQEHCHV